MWSPDQLNLNQSWSDERGLNSLEILSGLLSAYSATNDIKYYNAWQVREMGREREREGEREGERERERERERESLL